MLAIQKRKLGREGLEVSEENEKLVARALKDRRNKMVIYVKFGVTHTKGPKGDRAYVKKIVDASLYHLGLDYIALFYQPLRSEYPY